MRLVLAGVTARRQGLRPGPALELFQQYLGRLAAYGPVETISAESESALLDRVRRLSGRTAPSLVLLDQRGKLLSSEQLAANLEELRGRGTQHAVFAIGPAGGWTRETRAEASWLLSLGPFTLPHELAMVVLAEQLYRAQTIQAGHPYHTGH